MYGYSLECIRDSVLDIIDCEFYKLGWDILFRGVKL
ncbi:hypothetical protein 2016DhaA_0005 [Vibrio phage ICP1]|uniref:Uncharacterized protein ORF1 n=1 Tax=Vibrio phage ICP1 TaxID=979525 RepID=F1D123_9CAUD|nr:hypothetical protein ViPhICP1_gp001 [Vibrio phage ICP1]AXQ70626.1 hypothetical protein ICP12006E_001 [Vibrio phage ICP1_2006_E]AXQ70853.1 hypothetical protein ICP12012A_001 [Vibrio phage ICP1_2012_A]AXY82096.1 hypothetical protein ICP12011A_001 [Vibrio phage ICP1_2011_A]AXY82318.1 hypothetical protein ICP12011B_001 [Vibrio phage ICP1_2011_B]QFR59061.1 hypothetical protein ICP12017FMathbaria_001 [Vibrio phage ICP1_2017_F_Mathbaria]